jgi:hypothetical protein
VWKTTATRFLTEIPAQSEQIEQDYCHHEETQFLWGFFFHVTFCRTCQRAMCTNADLQFIFVGWIPDPQFHHCWKQCLQRILSSIGVLLLFNFRNFMCIWVLIIVSPLNKVFPNVSFPAGRTVLYDVSLLSFWYLWLVFPLIVFCQYIAQELCTDFSTGTLQLVPKIFDHTSHVLWGQNIATSR